MLKDQLEMLNRGVDGFMVGCVPMVDVPPTFPWTQLMGLDSAHRAAHMHS